jgi:hypothetical protein
MIAVTEVSSVPYINGQDWKILLTGSHVAFAVGRMNDHPNSVRDVLESRHSIHPMDIITIIITMDIRMMITCHGISP